MYYVGLYKFYNWVYCPLQMFNYYVLQLHVLYVYISYPIVDLPL